MLLNLPVKLTEQPRVILDMHSERGIVPVRLADRGKAVSGSPRFPERSVTLFVLVGDMVRLRVLKHKAVEPKIQNPPDHCIPMLVRSRREWQHLRGSAGVDLAIVSKVAAVERVLADIGIDFDSPLIGIAYHFRVELLCDVLVSETSELFPPGPWIEEA